MQGGTKIGHLNIGTGFMQYIAGLHIAMDQSFGIGKRQCAHALENNFRHFLNAKQIFWLAKFLQRAAFDILHHDVAHALLDHRIVNRHNVRVL